MLRGVTVVPATGQPPSGGLDADVSSWSPSRRPLRSGSTSGSPSPSRPLSTLTFDAGRAAGRTMRVLGGPPDGESDHERRHRTTRGGRLPRPDRPDACAPVGGKRDRG